MLGSLTSQSIPAVVLHNVPENDAVEAGAEFQFLDKSESRQLPACAALGITLLQIPHRQACWEVLCWPSASKKLEHIDIQLSLHAVEHSNLIPSINAHRASNSTLLSNTITFVLCLDGSLRLVGVQRFCCGPCLSARLCSVTVCLPLRRTQSL